MRLRACILAIAVVTPLRAFAQTPAAPADAPPPPPPPAAAPMPPPPPPPEPMPPPPVEVAAPMAPAAPAAPSAGPKFTWGGFVDTYYMYLFNPVDGANSLIGTVAPRQFDTNTNSATLNLAALSLNAAMDPVAFQLDIGYGSAGSIINNANGVVLPNMATSTTMTPGVQGNFVVLQAYGTISLLPQLTFDFGKFYTTAGAEVIQANKNWMYSRSILFFNIPLVHTGARANFKVNDMLSLQASLVNGWNDDPDVNAWKTVGLSATITPAPIATIVATTYIGKEQPQAAASSTPGDLRVLADIVAALTFSDKLGVNINFDYVKAPTNVGADYLVGVSAMARLVINDHLNVAARGEFVRGHTDVGNVNQDIMEGTVMVGLPVGKNFELRPEFRIDHLGQSTQFSNTGATNMMTGTLAALTYF
jgi:hypothetical protein